MPKKKKTTKKIKAPKEKKTKMVQNIEKMVTKETDISELI